LISEKPVSPEIAQAYISYNYLDRQ